MQLHHVISAALALPRHSDAHRHRAVAPLELRRVALALADDHVATVAAAPLEVTAARGPLLNRRDHLDEVVADRHERILQPEHSDSGIDVTDLEPKHSLQIID